MNRYFGGEEKRVSVIIWAGSKQGRVWKCMLVQISNPSPPTRAVHTQLNQVCRRDGTQMESPSRGTVESLCLQERWSKCRKQRPPNCVYLLHIWSVHCHSRCTFIIHTMTYPQCTAAAARSTPQWTPRWPVHCPRAALWQWCDESSPLGPGKRGRTCTFPN